MRLPLSSRAATVTEWLCVALALPLAATLHAQYRAPQVAPPSFANSTRADALIRANQMYLSLEDAVAIALESNLDIELERYGLRMADTDVLRAKGGGQLRGVGLTVSELPGSVTTPGEPLVTSAAGGISEASSIVASVSDVYPVDGNTTNLALNGGNSTVSEPFATGPSIPMYDPAITGQLAWQHQTTPQIDPAAVGSSALVAHGPTGSLGLGWGFSPGTQLGVNYNDTATSTNSTTYQFNPYTQSNLGLTVTQPLLRGFGISLNRRFIRIAGLDRKISDQVFREQVIATVSGVIRLYYDLVSLNEDLEVKRQTLQSAQRLLKDNQSQVEAGTLAPIEQTRAQAEVAAAQQDLITSEGFVLQQELLLKTVLTRRGTADPLLSSARMVPTTSITIPPTDESRPIDNLVKEALANRPEIAAADLQIEGGRINLEGSRNEMLPELDLVGTAQNSGLAANGTGALGQVASRDYPTYGVGIQLDLPLRNRQAEADVVRDELQVRQFQVRRQQVENQVRLEIENALIALGRAREALQAATQVVGLQEQSLELERDKFAVGLSTTFLITQYQSFVAQARSSEVAARNTWIKSRNALDRAMGRTLEVNGVSIEEAARGQVSRPPAALPAQP
jgi:outer membrane protein TolC